MVSPGDPSVKQGSQLIFPAFDFSEYLLDTLQASWDELPQPLL